VGISARHVSFLETGRSQASREMLVRLADGLDMPLRERNALLLAGGYAPIYPERAIDDPDLIHVRRAMELIVRSHEPFPALAIDRQWTMVMANRGIAPLLDGVAPHLLEPPVNVMRLALHPEGLAPRIVNFGELRAALLGRLRHEQEVTGDHGLEGLVAELTAYPNPDASRPAEDGRPPVVVPLVLRTQAGVLRFFSTTTVFGTAVDVTVSELAIESFFPADEATAGAMKSLLGTT
jgi:transcriptional regulator with XRE-family HTH domain